MESQNQEPTNEENKQEEQQPEAERYEERVDNIILGVMGSTEEDR